MQVVGRIDREIFKVVLKDIITDEVIITDERIEHIRERHPNDFERYERYLQEIVEQPDYLIEANKPHSAVALKEVVEDGLRLKLVLRLHTPNDPELFKNSVITFMQIDDRTWERLLRNKKVLYKRE